MKSLRKLERRDNLQSKATYSDCKISDFKLPSILLYPILLYYVSSFKYVAIALQKSVFKSTQNAGISSLLDPFVLMSENDAIILQKSVLTMVLT